MELENSNSNISNSKAGEWAINVNGLTKHFKGKIETVKAVDNIAFQVKTGEMFGLLGPNGAGKSTLINILTGVSSASSGEAYIRGNNITTDMNKVKEHIAVCPQEPAVYKFLTGMGNIKFFGNLYAMSSEEIEKRSEDLLNKLGLYDYRNRLSRGYSGGMLRQLSLIISLISDPEILFLDEPTVGMDPRNRRKVWNFLDLVKGQNKTIILTTHYIEEAEALCDRVAIVDYGQLIEIGSPKELIEKYQVNNLEEVFMEITGRSIREGF